MDGCPVSWAPEEGGAVGIRLEGWSVEEKWGAHFLFVGASHTAASSDSHTGRALETTKCLSFGLQGIHPFLSHQPKGD